jgi:hypothetical protein
MFFFTNFLLLIFFWDEYFSISENSRISVGGAKVVRGILVVKKVH